MSSIVHQLADPEGTSLRRRLLLTILPVVLVPLVIAGGIGYRIIGQRSEEQVQDQLKNQALLTSEGATAVLDDLLSVPRSIGASPLVVNEAIAGGQAAVTQGLDQLGIEALEEQYQDTKLLRNHQRLNQYLQETVGISDISEILVTESHGFNVAYSEPATDFVQSDETWWQQGKDQGSWIGSPDFDFAAKGYTVELAQAIHDPETGDFVGVIRAVLPTRKFSLLAQYVERTGISGSQQVQLIDGAALKVIDTFSPQGFLKDRDITGGKPVERLISALITVNQPQEDPQVILQALKASGPVGQLSISFSDETAAVVSFTHGGRQYKLASIPNTQWVAIASMEQSEIAAAGRNSLIFLVLTTVLLAGVTSALILWLARQLSAPLDSLANQAKLVAAGDFNVAVTPSGTQETRTLTESFNRLVVQVKDLLHRQENQTQKAQLFAAITGATATSLADLRPILDQALPEARTLLEADRILFYPVSDGWVEQLAVEAFAPGQTSGLDNPALTAGRLNSLLEADVKGSPLAIDNLATADLDPEHLAYLQGLNVTALLAIPVFNEEERFGTLIAHRSTSQPWQAADKAFMAQLAGQLKLVIDRVTALEKIQQSRQTTARLTDTNNQQTLQLSQNREQLEQQSELLLQQNQALRLHQEELRQRSEDQRRQKEALQQQITLLVEDIQGVLQGDLTVRARVAEGELQTVADVFNLTVARLQDLVSQVKQSSTQVNTILAQNQDMAERLTSAALDQALEATKTLNTVQQMIDSMGSIAENTHLAAAKAKTVATTAEVGETGMRQTAELVAQLNKTCASTVRQLEELLLIAPLPGAKPERMEAFLQTFQNKVVQAAKDLGQVNLQVGQTTQRVRTSQQDLNDVAAASRQFDQLTQAISSATRSQTNISRSVSKLVKEVVELSGQTVAFSQKMEQTLHETVQMAQSLQDSVSTLKVEQSAERTVG